MRQWSNWVARKSPFVLGSDEDVLLSERNARRTVEFAGWRAAYQARDFCAPKDSRLHLGLLPQPFIGDLNRASIYILGLNPGLGPGDYYGEYEVPPFRKALLSNLKQKFNPSWFPFLFLDPQYAWHGGFDWWHSKLAGVIECLSKAWRVDFAEARKRLAGRLASIELVPYHSKSASDWIPRLPSAAIARAFVADKIVPRVKEGKAIVVVLRQAKIWDLPEHNGIVCYSSKEARAASLSPKSHGGKAILNYLASGADEAKPGRKEISNEAHS